MATVKTAYAGWTAITITLASLATSSTWTVGRESTVVDNTSNLYDDVLVAGRITTGTTTATSAAILVYAYSVIDTSTYPTPFTGSDAGLTLTSANQAGGFLKLAAVLTTHTSAETSVAHEFAFGLAQLFGGIVPPKWGLFVAHNTNVNLHATAGNHVINYNGITYTVT